MSRILLDVTLLIIVRFRLTVAVRRQKTPFYFADSITNLSVFPRKRDEALFSVRGDGCCQSAVQPERVQIYTEKVARTNPEALNVSILSYYSRKRHWGNTFQVTLGTQIASRCQNVLKLCTDRAELSQPVTTVHRVHVEPSYNIHNARTEKERTHTLTIATSYNLYPRRIPHEY